MKRIGLYSAQALLAVALLSNSSQVLAAPQSSAPRVPVAPFHVFLRPQPGWIAQVSYWKFLDEDQGYEGVQPTQQDIQTYKYYKEIRYFKNAQDAADPNKFCKVLQDDPQGRLQTEIDKIGPDQYDKELYADGSLRVYTHEHEPDSVHGIGPWMDGVSISPQKQVVSRYSGGNGELITDGADGDVYRRRYFRGNEYLESVSSKDGCCKVRLNGSDRVDYEWTPLKESLWMETSSEFWMKFPGRVPFKVASLGTRDTYPRINRHRDPQEEAASREQATLEYGRRRAQFMAAYGALLIEAGQSWNSLGLEGVRDDMGMPKQIGTSEP